MAVTRITNVIVPSIYVPYQIELTKETDGFFTSGIIKDDAQIAAEMKNGGYTINMPFWNDLSGADTVTSDDPAAFITPYNVTASSQIAVVCRRAVSFASADLAGILAGSDPMKVVAQRVNPLWRRNMQTTLLKLVQGVFANSAFAADAKLDISVATGMTAANRLSAEAIIDAKATMGDAADDIKIIAMNSWVYHQLQKMNLIDFIPDARGEVSIPTYMGMRVVVNDGIASGLNGAAVTQTVYLFAPGAIGYGESMPKVPVAEERDEAAGAGEGVEYAYFRRHFCLHPYGFKWVGTPAGNSPTNAELATGTNWTKVFERKNIPMCALTFNRD